MHLIPLSLLSLLTERAALHVTCSLSLAQSFWARGQQGLRSTGLVGRQSARGSNTQKAKRGNKSLLLLPPIYSHVELLGYCIPSCVPNMFLFPKNIKVLGFEGGFGIIFFLICDVLLWIAFWCVSRFVWIWGVLCICVLSPLPVIETAANLTGCFFYPWSVLQVLDIFCRSIFHLNDTSQIWSKGSCSCPLVKKLS